jgi:short-subunit dehydrogenase
VVTGAARGIGEAYARELSSRGFDLILTDIDGDALESLASALRDRTHSIDTVVLDMVEPGSPSRLGEFSAERDVGLLICNHLLPVGNGLFLDRDLDHAHRQLDANVRAYLDLAYVFGNRLRDRGRGGLILMSSLSGVAGAPHTAVYGATKAFILALGEALAYELQGSGVDVLTLVPTPVRTSTYAAAAAGRARYLREIDVHEFVELALGALGRRWVSVPGWRNRLTAEIFVRLPRRTATTMMGHEMERLLGR